MGENIAGFIVGIIVIILGIINMTGNVSLLHSYHRNRVKEEDKKPFGLLVGIGTIIMGVAIIILSVLLTLALNNQDATYETIGYIVFGVVFTIGLGINIFAMVKYNKGVF